MRKVECATAINAATLTAGGKVGTILLTQVELFASSDGDFSDIDRVTITAGRRPSSSSLDQVVANPAAAAILHLHIGSVVRVGIDTNAQSSILPPYRSIDLHVVGLGVFNHQAVQDDIDKDHTGILLGSPALARRFSRCCTNVPYDAIQVAGHSPAVLAQVGREYASLIERLSPSNPQLLVYESSENAAAAQRAIRPQAIALGIFGAIAAMAALVIGLLAVSRQLAAGLGDAEALQAMGASPGALIVDALLGLEMAIIAGSLLGGVLALCLSPFTDIGPLSAVDPARGWNADWTVLGLGALVLVLGVGGGAVIVASRQARHRASSRRERTTSSRAISWAAALGMPAPGIAGLRFAIEPGQGRTAVPVRSTMVGAVLAMIVLVGTLTFGTSLNTLISHPALYGWNFDDALFSTDGFGPLPTDAFGPFLAKDHRLAATTPVWFFNFVIDGMIVPSMAVPLHAPIQPRALTGHALGGRHDIVLGSATLAALHVGLGDHVIVSGDGLSATRLTVVGTAALPAIGPTFSTHSSINTGALLPSAAVPTVVLDGGIPPEFAGPNALFVRFKPGTSPAAGQQSLEQVVRAFLRYSRSPAIEALTGQSSAFITVETLPVQRPAEIVNYRSMGATPGILAGALALGTLVALALTLIASVRRRRRDFAVLKTLGLTARQLSETVAWQASATVLVGIVVGVPLGIVLGRWLWSLFGRELSVVIDPTVPVVLLVVVGVAVLALANLIAALPGRIAARTSPASVLRSE